MTEYRNPQNEPGSDKRMLLALVAVFVVLGVMQYFMPKPQTPQDKGRSNNSSSRSRRQQTPSPAAVPTTSSTPVSPKSPAAAAKVPVKTAASETESSLETPTRIA